jgi:hypothetical protein
MSAIRITGVGEVVGRIDEAKQTPAKLINQISTFMERTAKKEARTLIYGTPSGEYTRTGKLAQSIAKQKQSKLKHKVFVGVNYGVYNETGTGIYNGRTAWKTSFGYLLDHPIWYKGMKARPYWSTAIKKTRKEAKKIIENYKV